MPVISKRTPPLHRQEKGVSVERCRRFPKVGTPCARPIRLDENGPENGNDDHRMVEKFVVRRISGGRKKHP
jgi:hypothetical protein